MPPSSLRKRVSADDGEVYSYMGCDEDPRSILSSGSPGSQRQAEDLAQIANSTGPCSRSVSQTVGIVSCETLIVDKGFGH